MSEARDTAGGFVAGSNPACLSQPDVEATVKAAFDRYAGALRSFALRAVRDAPEADDLVQESFLRLVRQLHLQPPPENVGGWLFRVCANLIASRGRHARICAQATWDVSVASVEPSAEASAVLRQDVEDMKLALAYMPSDARIALLMAAQGASAAEIGAHIGRSNGATRTYLSRARGRLKAALA